MFTSRGIPDPMLQEGGTMKRSTDSNERQCHLKQIEKSAILEHRESTGQGRI